MAAAADGRADPELHLPFHLRDTAPYQPVPHTPQEVQSAMAAARGGYLGLDGWLAHWLPSDGSARQALLRRCAVAIANNDARLVHRHERQEAFPCGHRGAPLRDQLLRGRVDEGGARLHLPVALPRPGARNGVSPHFGGSMQQLVYHVAHFGKMYACFLSFTHVSYVVHTSTPWMFCHRTLSCANLAAPPTHPSPTWTQCAGWQPGIHAPGRPALLKGARAVHPGCTPPAATDFCRSRRYRDPLSQNPGGGRMVPCAARRQPQDQPQRRRDHGGGHQR